MAPHKESLITAAKEHQLKIDITILAMAALANPIWGWFTPALLLPGAIDSVLSRMIGAAVAYVGLVALLFRSLRRFSGTFVAINNFTLVGHYVWLCYANNFHPVYASGIYIPMVAAAIFFESQRLLLVFAVFVPLASAAILLQAAPLTNPSFFLLGVTTVQTISCLTSMARIRAHRRAAQLLSEKEAMQLRALAVEAERAKQEHLTRMVAGIAHEINTPLAVITAVQELLMTAGSRVGDVVKTRLPASERACIKIANIVSDLHAVVFGTYSSRTESWTLENLIKTAVAAVRSDFPAAAVSVQYDGRWSDLSLEIDPVVTPKALQSVLKNAVQAAIDSVERHVEIHFDPKNADLFVVNSGVPIPPSKAKLMFEAFFTDRGPGLGVGLGLCTARAAMQKIGGSLEYLPEEPRTTFVMNFANSVKYRP